MKNRFSYAFPARGIGVFSVSVAVLTCAMFLSLLTGSAAQSQTGDEAALSQVLAQMEAIGKSFKTFQASFVQKKYTAVLREFDTPESGQFLYARAKDGSALLRQEVYKPGPRILTIMGGQATIYQPTLKQAQIVSLGKNKDKAEYLALGLGQSPGKLQESFNISYHGIENVGRAPCSVLVLKPRSTGAAAYFTAITLWIKKSNGIPIQQKLQEPNGDYLLVEFSNERLNGSIPAARFEQNLPAGIDIMRIQ